MHIFNKSVYFETFLNCTSWLGIPVMVNNLILLVCMCYPLVIHSQKMINYRQSDKFTFPPQLLPQHCPLPCSEMKNVSPVRYASSISGRPAVKMWLICSSHIPALPLGSLRLRNRSASRGWWGSLINTFRCERPLALGAAAVRTVRGVVCLKKKKLELSKW